MQLGIISIGFWAFVPPLLLLSYYYFRVIAAPPLPRLLLFFIVGAVSGLTALSLEWCFEFLANLVGNWQQITRTLPGVALRQLVEVGPIEEGCKLLAVVLTSAYLQRWHQLRPRHPSTVFLYTIAVALGFAAEENWVYLYYGTASIFDRLIGTPVHALFSAPWGYALAIATCSTFQLSPYWRLVAASWINAVICHALVNVLSSAWRYSPPISFLSYGLFPFLLWMFWRMMQLLRRVQDRPPITLISNNTPQQRYWHFSLAICALILGGNAIFGLFLLVRTISPLSLSKLFYPDVLWFIVTRLGLNLILGILAWGIYRYLRYGANRR